MSFRMSREAAGSLIYLFTRTRPDLTYLRSQQVISQPTWSYRVTVRKVWGSSVRLVKLASADADWAVTLVSVSLSKDNSLVSTNGSTLHLPGGVDSFNHPRVSLPAEPTGESLQIHTRTTRDQLVWLTTLETGRGWRHEAAERLICSQIRLTKKNIWWTQLGEFQQFFWAVLGGSKSNNHHSDGSVWPLEGRKPQLSFSKVQYQFSPTNRWAGTSCCTSPCWNYCWNN